MALRDLSAGMTGEDVRQIQLALNLQADLAGPPLKANGMFDPATEQRLRAYQAKKHLPVTGAVSTKTYRALYPCGMANIMIVAPRSRAAQFAVPMSRAPPDFFCRPSPWRSSPNASLSGWNGGLSSQNPRSSRLGRDFAPGFHSRNEIAQTNTVTYSQSTKHDVEWRDPNDTSWLTLQLEQQAAQNEKEVVRLPQGPCPVVAATPPEVSPYVPKDDAADWWENFGQFALDHSEIVPGAQVSYPPTGLMHNLLHDPKGLIRDAQAVYTLTIQTVYQDGPDDDPHNELTYGLQIGQSLLGFYSDGSPMTINPFVQLSHVFALDPVDWQPYAQLGLQATTGGGSLPQVTAGVFPINLTMDVVKDRIQVQLFGGLVGAISLSTFNFDPANSGVQGGVGINVNLDAVFGWDPFRFLRGLSF